MSDATDREGLASPRAGISPAAAWFTVVVLNVMSILSLMDRNIVYLLAQPIKRDLHLSDLQIGALQGLAFALLYCAAALPIGWAIDRISRRLIIFLGVVFWSISAVSCGLARTFPQLFLRRMGVGIGEATLSPSAFSLISDCFPPDRLAMPMGVFNTGLNIGSGLAFIAGGAIVGFVEAHPALALPVFGKVSGWQAAFMITGAPGLVIAFLAFAMPDPRPGLRSSVSEATIGEFLRFVRRNWRILAHQFVGFPLLALAYYSIYSWAPTFLVRVHGWTLRDAGLGLGAVTLTLVLAGGVMGGWLVDRLYRRGVADAHFRVHVFTTLVGVPVVIAAFLVGDGMTFLVLMGLGMMIFGSFGGGSYSALQIVTPPRMRGKLSSAYVFFLGLVGAAFGPLAVGFVSDKVLHDETKLGLFVVIVISVMGILGALTLATGLRALRRATIV